MNVISTILSFAEKVFQMAVYIVRNTVLLFPKLLRSRVTVALYDEGGSSRKESASTPVSRERTLLWALLIVNIATLTMLFELVQVQRQGLEAAEMTARALDTTVKAVDYVPLLMTAREQIVVCDDS